MMQKEFSGAEPARIEIGKISAWESMQCGIAPLMSDQHPLHVEPHASREKQSHEHARVSIA
jgi:hypothetical protein